MATTPMTATHAWHLVDGVYEQALDKGFECTKRWSQEGDQAGHYTGYVDLGDAGHLAWDSVTGWVLHTPDGATTEIAAAEDEPRDVVGPLDWPNT